MRDLPLVPVTFTETQTWPGLDKKSNFSVTGSFIEAIE